MRNPPSLMQELLMETLELPEKLDGTKLTQGNKNAFRAQAQRGRDKIAAWRNRCTQLKAQGKDCHIHHIIPLQYIHLFKGRNPNKRNNVLLLSDEQHKKIHTALRNWLNKATTIEQKKKRLETFRKWILASKNYSNAKVPPSFKGPVLKELFREANI